MKPILLIVFLLCNYLAFSQPIQIRIPVANGNDDVEISTDFYIGSSDLELGGFDNANAGAQYVAIRFQNVALPANAQISEAYTRSSRYFLLPSTGVLV
jgi:hypothetical protein